MAAVFINKKQRRVKRLSQKLVFLFVILLLLVAVMWAYLGNSSQSFVQSDKALRTHIQERLYSGKAFVEEAMIELEEEFWVGGKEAFVSHSARLTKDYPNSFAFYIYDKDSLVLWSSSEVAMPLYLKQLKSNRFQKIGLSHCFVYKHDMNRYTLVALQLINKEYPWQNEVLQNAMVPYFGLSNRVFVSQNPGLIIKSPWEGVNFFVQKNSIGKVATNWLYIVLFSIAFILWAAAFRVLLNIVYIRNPIWRTIVFVLSMGLWYMAHVYFNVPQNVFKTELFSPTLYAGAYFFISFGHLYFFFFSIFLSLIYYYFQPKKKYTPRLLVSYVYTIFLYLSFAFIMDIIWGLIRDSQISFNLFDLANINIYSYMGIVLMFFLQASWVILSINLVQRVKRSVQFSIMHLIFAMIISLVILYFAYDDKLLFFVFYVVVSAFVCIWFFYSKVNKQNRFVLEAFLYLILLSCTTTWFLTTNNELKEREMRQNQAATWEPKNDAFLETQFLMSYDSIQRLLENITAAEHGDLSHKDLKKVVLPFFENYLPYYDISTHYCLVKNTEIDTTTNVVDSLALQYKVSMDFKFLTAEDVIVNDTLCLLHGDLKYRNYLGNVKVPYQDGAYTAYAYIEFVSKPQVKEIGLPAMLQNNSYAKLKTRNRYSYAVYNNGVLLEKAGEYNYQGGFTSYIMTDTLANGFYTKNKYSHYSYKTADSSVLILSLPLPKLPHYLSSFAFILIIYTFLSLLAYTVVYNRFLLDYFYSFQGKVQYAILGMLIFTFVTIGIVGLYSIYDLNENKNKKFIGEKATIMRKVFENQTSTTDLQVFYDYFHTDVIFYDESGKLLNSTRPEIFSRYLLSPLMSPQVLYNTHWGNSNMHIVKEHIGKQSYYSCYVPFHFKGDEKISYLNMPYFSNQSEIETELTSFAQLFLNVNLFLMIFAIIAGIVISRMLGRPLAMMKNKLRALKLHAGTTNEKIEWFRNDEIGSLVNAYNKMVDELSVSAKKLAASEREGAWHEMAKQVAHEIKNPLTPMKLNVQYLQMAWDNKAKDFDTRLANICKGLEEQIDVLNHIATQFSTFAAITVSKFEKVEIKSLIEDGVLQVFNATVNVQFVFQSDIDQACVMADRSQMIRVFNNLYKNSIQAMVEGREGLIQTHIYQRGIDVIVEIQDNGCGIAPEKFEYIFRPHFTTKTTGTGLGLALVKKMIETTGGTINIESEIDVYTKVIVSLPLCSRSEV